MKNTSTIYRLPGFLHQNSWLDGVAFIDRPAVSQSFEIINSRIVYKQNCGLSSVSGYMRLNATTSDKKLIATVTITESFAHPAVGFWTAAEVRHAGISIFHSDPDNNYILMISPAASAVSEFDVQLVKQVAGLESALVLAKAPVLISLNTKYILELGRVSGLITGRVKDINGNLISEVSIVDTSLSTGGYGVHGFATTYVVEDLRVEDI